MSVRSLAVCVGTTFLRVTVMSGSGKGEVRVDWAGDKAMMMAKMMGLSQRHHKYGVRTYHSPIMGQTIMAMLQAAVGEEWTAEMAKAWQEHWDSCCAAMNERIIGWEK